MRLSSSTDTLTLLNLSSGSVRVLKPLSSTSRKWLENLVIKERFIN